MWKYVVLDREGKIHYDIFEADMEYNASIMAGYLEKQGFEVLYLSKITPMELGSYLLRMPLLERHRTYASNGGKA